MLAFFNSRWDSLIFPGMVALAGLSFLIYHLYEKRRTRKWREIAESLGLKFSERDDSVMERGSDIHLFTLGHSRKAKNVLEGDANGIDIILADYHYTTGGGKNSTTHLQTICLAKSPELNIPVSNMRPQSFFDSIGKLLGGQDIDFETDPEFSQAFVLQGKDEQEVRACFGSEVRRWFCSGAKLKMYFEAGGDTLLFHQGHRVNPEDAQELLGQALELVKLFARKK